MFGEYTVYVAAIVAVGDVEPRTALSCFLIAGPRDYVLAASNRAAGTFRICHFYSNKTYDLYTLCSIIIDAAYNYRNTRCAS